MQLHAAEGQPVEEAGNIGEVAAEPVDRLANNDVEAPRFGVGQQAEKSRAQLRARVAQRAIVINRAQRPTLTLDLAPATST